VRQSIKFLLIVAAESSPTVSSHPTELGPGFQRAFPKFLEQFVEGFPIPEPIRPAPSVQSNDLRAEARIMFQRKWTEATGSSVLFPFLIISVSVFAYSYWGLCAGRTSAPPYSSFSSGASGWQLTGLPVPIRKVVDYYTRDELGQILRHQQDIHFVRSQGIFSLLSSFSHIRCFHESRG
jgi:hypothetical protein